MQKLSILSSVEEIAPSDWERLFCNNGIEGRGYYKSLEDAGLKEFSQHYLVAKDNERLIAIIPFFTTDFSFTTITQGPPQKAILNIRKLFKRFLMAKILFVGAPTTEEFHLPLDSHAGLEETLGEALKEILRFTQAQKCSATLFYNIPQSQGRLANFLLGQGFARMENYPSSQIEINAGSLEEYINGLSSNMRKNLRRKLKNSAERVELKTEVTENIDNIIDEVHKLYMSNFSESDVRFETLTPEFFKNICRNMPGVAKFFITRAQDKIVAFNLCLAKDSTLVDKFIGFDPEVSKEYSLYYTTFCHNLDWCIKNNIRYYTLGITDYHPKIRLGAKLIPLYNYVKLLNPLLNIFTPALVKLLEPARFDPTLKKLRSHKTN